MEKKCDNCKFDVENVVQYCVKCYDRDKWELHEEPEKKVDMINHPPHYEREGAMECIDEIELVFGREVAMHFCLANVWKYRYRSGLKGDAHNDIAKSDWYLRKYNQLKEAGEKGSATIKITPNTSWVDSLFNDKAKK